jgi:hypothetical protein
MTGSSLSNLTVANHAPDAGWLEVGNCVMVNAPAEPGPFRVLRKNVSRVPLAPGAVAERFEVEMNVANLIAVDHAPDAKDIRLTPGKAR